MTLSSCHKCVFGWLWVLSPPVPVERRVICEAALSHHLPATCEQLDGQDAFHSSLFLPPQSLLHAAACSTQEKNRLDRNKMKSCTYDFVPALQQNSYLLLFMLPWHGLLTLDDDGDDDVDTYKYLFYSKAPKETWTWWISKSAILSSLRSPTSSLCTSFGKPSNLQITEIFPS